MCYTYIPHVGHDRYDFRAVRGLSLRRIIFTFNITLKFICLSDIQNLKNNEKPVCDVVTLLYGTR